MACYNDSDCGIHLVENEIQNLRIISDSWLVVDRSAVSESSNPCGPPNLTKESLTSSLSSKVVSQLQPFVPFSVEELSFITKLDMWSNCNVRVVGYLKVIEGEYYIESIDEVGGPYKVPVVLTRVASLPVLNEFIQLFGEISMVRCNGSWKPIIRVTFFKNIEIGNITLYREAIERLKPYIPLYVSTKDNTETLHNMDDNFYYNSHQHCDNNSDEDVYSNDDFNFGYDNDY